MCPDTFEPAGNTTLPSTTTSCASVAEKLSPTTLSFVLTSASIVSASAVPDGTIVPGLVGAGCDVAGGGVDLGFDRFGVVDDAGGGAGSGWGSVTPGANVSP